MGHQTQIKELLRLEKEKALCPGCPHHLPGISQEMRLESAKEKMEKPARIWYDRPIIPQLGSQEDGYRSWEGAQKQNDSARSQSVSE